MERKGWNSGDGWEQVADQRGGGRPWGLGRAGPSPGRAEAAEAGGVFSELPLRQRLSSGYKRVSHPRVT